MKRVASRQRINNAARVGKLLNRGRISGVVAFSSQRYVATNRATTSLHFHAAADVIMNTLQNDTLLSSSMAEHPAVNRRVVGSSPT